MLVTPARLSRAFAILVVTGALAATANPAQAHGELVSSNPADGASLTELASVRLEFSEELLDIGNSVTVTDSSGAVQDLVLTYPQPNAIEAPVAAVAPGAVTIAWRNASVDGHSEEGELHVTVETPVATQAPDASPSAQLTLISAAPSPSITAVPTAVAPAGPNPWVIAVLGLLIIGGAAAAIIAATRRQPGEAPGPSEAPGPDQTPGAGE